jgi:hypothetical protein
MNPFLPQTEYIPDTEARVWADGRLYIYGSRDIGGVEDYCSSEYKVFSTDDLIRWQDHGISFRGAQADFCPSDTLFAPDCVYRNGRYYLFYCLPGEGGREGVAVSDHPAGPFENLGPVKGADGYGIDPAVLVDHDGQAYLYWGQAALRVAKLSDDMCAILPETLQVGILSEQAHGFHEGASIRRIGDKYYLLYCDGARDRATCLSYAIADSPYGPFQRMGVLIDNTNCDPLSWNIHGSLCAFKGQWYVFYHRSSANSRYNRRCCIEPITLHSDGRIDEVKPSTQGAGAPIAATTCLGAWRACALYGRIFTKVEDAVEYLQSEGEGNIATFRDLLFSGESKVSVCLRGHGRFAINLGSPGVAVACIEVASEAEWTTVSVPIEMPPQGVQSMQFYTFAGRLQIQSIQFEA